MKVLNIDFEYYYFPDGITCIEGFIDYLNSNYNSFIGLLHFETDNCKFPYFIEGDTKKVFLNIATMSNISEAEATVLCREEYQSRLAVLVSRKCIDCVHYEEDMQGDNLKGHGEKLSLDGECFWYEKKE